MNNHALATRPPQPPALVTVERAPAMTLQEILTVGDMLAKSGFFKDTRTQEQAVAKILWGKELGIAPVSAINGIYVIEGKLSMSANLMATLVKLSHDYDYRITRLDGDGCVLTFWERGELLGESSFVKADAERAMLLGNANWKKYPRNMFFARAMSNGFRLFTPHLAGGTPVYTPEELDADVDEDGTPAVTVSGGETTSEREERERGRFFARARDLGYGTHVLIHEAMGVAPEKGALGEFVNRHYGGDWHAALMQLEAKGPYQEPVPVFERVPFDDAAPLPTGLPDADPPVDTGCPVCGDPLMTLGYGADGDELPAEFCEPHQLEAELHDLPEEVTNQGRLLELATVRKGLNGAEVRTYAKQACPTWPKPPYGETWTREQLARVWRSIPLAPPPHVEPRTVEALHGSPP